MDNPQGSPTVAWAWITGLWLSDGTFGLYPRYRKNQRPFYRPTVTFVNTDLELCKSIYQVLRQLGVGAYLRSYPNDNPKHRTIHRVSVDSWEKARRLCEGMLPFAAGAKHQQILLILEAANMRGGQVGKHYSTEQVGRLQQISDELKTLKWQREPSETIMADAA